MIYLPNFDCQSFFPKKGFLVKRYGGTGLISEKTEVLYAEPNERAKGAISSYSATGDF